MEVRGCGAGGGASGCSRTGSAEGWTIRQLYRRLQELARRPHAGRQDARPTPSIPSVLRRAEEAFEEPLYIHLAPPPLRHDPLLRGGEARPGLLPPAAHPFSRRELAELIWLVSHDNILRFLARGARRSAGTGSASRTWCASRSGTLRARSARFLGLDFDPAMAEPYEERPARMTDGLHAESRMLGDVKFHQHRRVDAGVGGALAGAERRRTSSARPAGWPRRSATPMPRPGPPRDAVADQCRRRIAGGRGPGEPLPLSFAQERLWFLDRLEPGERAYNIPVALRLDRPPRPPPALAPGPGGDRRRHDALRTTFVEPPSGPSRRCSRPAGRCALPVVDLAALPEPARARPRPPRLAAARGARPFDLAAGAAVRAALLRAGAPRSTRLLITLHHIAADGWSMGVLTSRAGGALRGAGRPGRPSPLPELPIQYADFAAWQRRPAGGRGRSKRELAYWRERAGRRPAAARAAHRPAAARGADASAARRVPVRAAARRSSPAPCRRSAGEQGATLFMTLLAAFQALLARFAGQEDVVVGSPVAGRNRAGDRGADRLLRQHPGAAHRPRGRPDLPRAAAPRAATVRRGAFAHQELPFERLVEELAPERNLAPRRCSR